MQPRTLVVGAGIAGLATANALERVGASPRIVERADTLRPPGLGLAMMPNGVRALDALGLGERVRSCGLPQQEAARWSVDGDPIGTLDLAAARERFGPTLGLHRDALMEVLTAELDAEVRLGTTVEGLEDGEAGVEVRFSDGSSDRFDLVVGADGLHSGLGPRVFGDTGLHYRDYRAWRVVLPRTDRDSEQTEFHLGPGTFVGLFPVREDALYLFALEHGPDDEASAGDALGHVRRVAARFARLGDVIAERLVPGTPAIYTPVYEVIREHWVRGRIALVGDAAHAIVPFQAQGAAQALEDAVVLGRALAEASDLEGALTAWLELRHARVTAVRHACRFLGQLTGLEGPPDPVALASHPGNLGSSAKTQVLLWSGVDA